MTVAGKASCQPRPTPRARSRAPPPQVVAALNAIGRRGARHGRAVPRQRGRRRRPADGPTQAERQPEAPRRPSARPVPGEGLRIGKNRKRDGSKIGVFLYCQEHAREWVTSLVCLETAERLLRNYGTDPRPRSWSTTSTSSSSRRSTPTARTTPCTTTTCSAEHDQLLRGEPRATPTRRRATPGAWTSTATSRSARSSTATTAPRRAAPATRSPARPSCPSPRPRTRSRIQSKYPNIKFAMNMHSYGGYFMWPPGAYKAAARRCRPPYGTENSSTRRRPRSERSTATAVRRSPGATGPVRTSCTRPPVTAPTSHYNRGIIGWDFEVGATEARGGRHDRIPRLSAQVRPDANRRQPQPRQRGRSTRASSKPTATTRCCSPRSTTRATRPPRPPHGDRRDAVERSCGREVHDERGGLDLLHDDGSTPTTASTEWKPIRPRELPDPVEIGANTTLKWIAVDFKGNTSAVQSKDTWSTWSSRRSRSATRPPTARRSRRAAGSC